jgi:AcrR family transcriptional regulator
VARGDDSAVAQGPPAAPSSASPEASTALRTPSALKSSGTRSTPGNGAARQVKVSATPIGLNGAADLAGSPASRRALRKQGQRTMRKLLDAAMVAFDRRGYHATRVNDVVEIAKTSHGTFYLYFSNKEDLLRALVAEAAQEAQALHSLWPTEPDGDASWDDVRLWIGAYSSLWIRYAPLLRGWTDLASIDPELGDQVRNIMTGLSGALSDQIADSRGRGSVDPAAAGLAVLAMLDRFHYLREFVGEPVDAASLDALCSIVHRALFELPGTR